ncbi:MAG: hypothetical protein NVS1B4_07650 [Gemmatimonadaceae bacterium]
MLPAHFAVQSAAAIMDREPSIGVLWSVFMVLGSAGFAAGRFRPQELWLVVPAIAVLGLAQRAELFDGAVKPRILDEVGTAYFTHSYVAMGSALLLTILGAAWRWHARHHRSHLQAHESAEMAVRSATARAA